MGVALPVSGCDFPIGRALLWIVGFGILVLVARIAILIVFEPLLDFAGPPGMRAANHEALEGNVIFLLALLPMVWIVMFFEEWLV